jgi:L-ribulose-5-phosphate 3-epimerase
MQIGVLISLHHVEEKMKESAGYGFKSCQIVSWDMGAFTEENAALVKKVAKETGMTISTFWCGLPGPATWNFTDGPLTLGLVPESYRFERTKALIRGVEFAHACGISQIATHVGFIPEDMNDPRYAGTLVALKQVVRACKKYNMRFLFETGQETPVTLLRTLEDLGGENVGINLDTGNLILYGKANPVDALDVFGKYVFDTHCKDGEYPTNGRELGNEKPLGQGAVDWPKLVAKLKALGYEGPLTIEREISGPQQTKDILAAKAMLEKLTAN